MAPLREIKAKIWCDGAARKKPNPGPAGAGYIIEIDGQDPIEMPVPLGIATNNVAEYEAVLRALADARERGVTDVELKTDSPVVVGHYTGAWKCRAIHLQDLLEQLIDRVRSFPGTVTITRIPRKENRRADCLAGEGRSRSERMERFMWHEGDVEIISRGNPRSGGEEA